MTVNYNTWEQLGSQIELGVGGTVTLADQMAHKVILILAFFALRSTFAQLEVAVIYFEKFFMYT